MILPKPRIHSFIVRIFHDEVGEGSDRPGWHGYVTHVPSGEQKYLKNLEDILVFVEHYIQINQDYASEESHQVNE